MPVDPKAVCALPSKTRKTFPICRRIRQRSEFEQAFRAEQLNNKWFVVYVRKNKSGFARLGIIASKKIMPRAASRNFVKRLIRETFRCKFPVGRALDIVVRAKRQISPESLAEGQLALMQLLQTIQA